ncbi:uracil-DNA glycosylase [Candidatus Microgenomates bacterium]|nr:MAG: uracil-DNA glycosylase [Candidatus Microgenomates bacterium]
MSKAEKLAKLAKLIETCTRCPLYKDAIHAVPGEGDPDARVLFVGEAPGRNEDETGRPFVGRAGKLLTSLLESTGIKRESVFITSVIKHRPPKNRQPKPNEIKACADWLDKQLAIIKPKVIVPLGRFGMEHFLPGETITNAHGKVFEKPDWIVFPVYHPAYGLRGNRALAALKDDFLELKRVLLKEKII